MELHEIVAAVGDIAKLVRKTTSKAVSTRTTPAAAADELYQLRELRYGINKVVEDIEKKEAALRNLLIEKLKAKESTGVSGKVATASIVPKEIVVVTDWDKLYKYILTNAPKNKAVWGMLQKRVSDGMAKEMAHANLKAAKAAGFELGTVDAISSTKIS